VGRLSQGCAALALGYSHSLPPGVECIKPIKQYTGVPCYIPGMRKTTFVKTLSCRISLLFFVALGIVCRPAIAQDAAAAPAKEAPAFALPSDPKALMLLAAKTNGLTGEDVKPWHLKVSFTLFDDKGNIKDNGTFEEYRVSAHLYKIIFTSTAFSQTDYFTDNGILRSGAREPAPGSLSQLRNEFINPLEQSAQSMKDPKYSKNHRKLDGLKLLCLDETGKWTVPPYPAYIGPTYCFDEDKSALRFIMRGMEPNESHYIYNNIIRFQNRYLPGDIVASRRKKLFFKAHIDAIELLKTIDDSIFIPTADAKPWPPLVTISAAEAQGLHLQQNEPVYPPIALAAHLGGLVVLRAVIGKDGRVLSVGVISGPAMLQQAAIDAVEQWVYKPYLLNNVPTEVNTTIKILFPLNFNIAPNRIPESGHPHAVF